MCNSIIFNVRIYLRSDSYACETVRLHLSRQQCFRRMNKFTYVYFAAEWCIHVNPRRRPKCIYVRILMLNAEPRISGLLLRRGWFEHDIALDPLSAKNLAAISKIIHVTYSNISLIAQCACMRAYFFWKLFHRYICHVVFTMLYGGDDNLFISSKNSLIIVVW